MNEIRTITRGIFYCRDSAEINDCGSLQLQHGLTVKCSEIGNKNIPPSVMFYFEGSRQDKNKISITVLSHLWLTDDETIIDKFCGENKWWTKANFLNIKNRLAVDKKIIERSYITDAIRFDSDDKNKEIIKKEIDFFKPKLVVCIGNKARDLVGMRFYDFPVQFHYVKFPKYHSDNNIYLELNEIFKKIID